MSTRTLSQLWLAGLAAVITACTGTARGLEAYRADTTHLLESRQPQITACYTQALAADATLAGTVTVTFTVEPRTGAVVDPVVAADRTTAPPVVGQCVVKALAGLALAPPDQNPGKATYVYELHAAPAS